MVASISLAAQARPERVYIADDGSLYHRIDCPTIKGISKIVGHQRDQLPPKSEPCGICHPDGEPEPAPIVIGPTPATIPVAPKWTLGPQLLTDATYKEAITCGSESPWWRACAEENLSLECGASQVSVSLLTPFVRVMMDVDRATKQLQRAAPPSLTEANRIITTVTVSPGTNLLTMRSPTRMVIEKNGARIDPVSASLMPVTMENSFGVKRSAANGVFVFPIGVFAPTAPLTVLIALNAGDPVRCELGIEKLRQMR